VESESFCRAAAQRRIEAALALLHLQTSRIIPFCHGLRSQHFLRKRSDAISQHCGLNGAPSREICRGDLPAAHTSGCSTHWDVLTTESGPTHPIGGVEQGK
jgi:hypothetical protein